MDDFYLIAITALLPLTAVLLVLQVNPYQALVMRGILGAIAALVYALFGAADVALTEALVGTMLSITLYAVAVRSSMEMRLGWVQPQPSAPQPSLTADAIASAEAEVNSSGAEIAKNSDSPLDETLVTALRQALKLHHLRLEILAYPNLEAMQVALETKRIHSAVWSGVTVEPLPTSAGPYPIQVRVKRLYDILSDRLPPELATVEYFDLVPTSPASPGRPLAQSSHSHTA